MLMTGRPKKTDVPRFAPFPWFLGGYLRCKIVKSIHLTEKRALRKQKCKAAHPSIRNCYYMITQIDYSRTCFLSHYNLSLHCTASTDLLYLCVVKKMNPEKHEQTSTTLIIVSININYCMSTLLELILKMKFGCHIWTRIIWQTLILKLKNCSFV